MFSELFSFLRCRTPLEWLQRATVNIETLLIDHASSELKAASTAVSLMFQYPSYSEFCKLMPRLAREEIKHFELVQQYIKKYNFQYIRLKPSRYAKNLHNNARTFHPERLIDFLIINAIIEARSCERFYALGDVLPSDLAEFYHQLAKVEARHYQIYINLAQKISKENIDKRVDELLQIENNLITQPEDVFRFHSGIPTDISCSTLAPFTDATVP